MSQSLKVICIKSKTSTKLIKDAIYLATSKHGDRVYIKDVGNYPINYFTLTDGSSIDTVKDFYSKYKEFFKDHTVNYIGQYVRCRCGSGKILKDGEIYLVENQKVEQKKNWNGNYYEIKFKIRGIRNFISTDRFQEIPIIEQRKLKLKNLKGDKIKTGEQTRKFLHYDEKNKSMILLETLTKVLYDINKAEINHKLNIIEMMLIKGKNYNLLEEDIEAFLNNNIQNLLIPYNF